jgi:hypothetical protein
MTTRAEAQAEYEAALAARRADRAEYMRDVVLPIVAVGGDASVPLQQYAAQAFTPGTPSHRVVEALRVLASLPPGS